MAVSNEPVSIQSVSKTEPIDQTRQLGDDLSQHTTAESMHQIESSLEIQDIEISSQADASLAQRQEAEQSHLASDAGATLAEETIVEADRHSTEQEGAFQADQHSFGQQGLLQVEHHNIEQQVAFQADGNSSEQQMALQADRNNIEQQVAELEGRLGPGDWTRYVCLEDCIQQRSLLLTWSGASCPESSTQHSSV